MECVKIVLYMGEGSGHLISQILHYFIVVLIMKPCRFWTHIKTSVASSPPHYFVIKEVVRNIIISLPQAKEGWYSFGRNMHTYHSLPQFATVPPFLYTCYYCCIILSLSTTLLSCWQHFQGYLMMTEWGQWRIIALDSLHKLLLTEELELLERTFRLIVGFWLYIW